MFLTGPRNPPDPWNNLQHAPSCCIHGRRRPRFPRDLVDRLKDPRLETIASHDAVEGWIFLCVWQPSWTNPVRMARGSDDGRLSEVIPLRFGCP